MPQAGCRRLPTLTASCKPPLHRQAAAARRRPLRRASYHATGKLQPLADDHCVVRLTSRCCVVAFASGACVDAPAPCSTAAHGGMTAHADCTVQAIPPQAHCSCSPTLAAPCKPLRCRRAAAARRRWLRRASHCAAGVLQPLADADRAEQAIMPQASCSCSRSPTTTASCGSSIAAASWPTSVAFASGACVDAPVPRSTVAHWA